MGGDALTSLPCPLDGHMMPAARRVCGACENKLMRELADVPDLAADLEIARARLSRMGGGGGRDEPEPDEPGTVPGVHVQRLPWDDRASKAMDALKNELTTWARITPLTGEVMMPDDDMASIGKWLHEHAKDLLRLDAAPEVVEGIVDAVRRARDAIDRRPDKVYAGPCDECGSDMYAKLGAAVVWCPTCRDDKGKLCESYDVAVRRSWLLDEAQDVLGTATEIARAVTSLVHPIAPELIRTWKQRGRITQHGTDTLDRPLYRLGDVVELMLKTPVKTG